MNPIFYIKSALGKKTKHITFIIVATLFIQTGCKKYLLIDPPATSTNGGNVYQESSTAIAVLSAIYTKMSNNFGDQGPTALSLYPELSADNLTLFSTTANTIYTNYYQNLLTQNNPGGLASFWKTFYPYIYSCNAAIEGLNSSTTINSNVKQRLLGEAYFVRAFNYFYLVNLYGDIPLLTSSVFQTSVKTPRTPVVTVYQQIIDDLDHAKTLLDNRYLDATLLAESTERVRPNLAAVNALLARVQLYLKNYPAAEAAANDVINEGTLYSSSIPPDQVFLKNSKETIWALQPVKNDYNTDEGDLFLLPSGGPNNTNPMYASSQLMASFEPGDQRRYTWINTVSVDAKTYPYFAKYKAKTGSGSVTEYSIVLRLAEQYLIRAEARNEQGNMSGAISDLNVLRTRSRAEVTADIPNPLPDLSSSLTQEQIRDHILWERRVELFAEGGHRWLDLKRLNKVNEVMTTVTPSKGGGAWTAYKALYPIPLADILSSPVLKQNPGYN